MYKFLTFSRVCKILTFVSLLSSLYGCRIIKYIFGKWSQTLDFSVSIHITYV